MPVTFTKKIATKPKAQKVTHKSAKETAMAEMGGLVDPLYDLLAQAKAMRAKLSKLDAAIKPQKEAFLKTYNKAYGIDDAEMAQGKQHALKISAASKRRVLTNIDECFDLLEKVGPGLFAELAKVSLGDLDKYLTPEQLEQIVEVVQDPMGRSITPVTE